LDRVQERLDGASENFSTLEDTEPQFLDTDVSADVGRMKVAADSGNIFDINEAAEPAVEKMQNPSLGLTR
jgi:hypothetical protein